MQAVSAINTHTWLVLFWLSHKGKYKILNLLHANVKKAYSAIAQPPLWKSDHNLVFPTHIQTLCKEIACYKSYFEEVDMGG